MNFSIFIFSAAVIMAGTGTMAQASTFVGNGGNAGDIELQVAYRQLADTFDIIRNNLKDPEMKLCTCYPEMEGRPVCETLKALTPAQVKMCSSFIRDNADGIAELLSNREQIQLTWTHSPIEVREGSGMRGADAVTEPNSKSITINQEKFVSLNSSERLFLLSHEVFHLTKANGAYLKDEGENGAFKGKTGGRDFINAMASAMVVEAYTDGIFTRYSNTLDRSMAYKKIWLFAETGSSSSGAEGTYAQKDLKGIGLGVRYQFGDWGLVAEYESFEGKKNILTSIEAAQKNVIYSAGVAYKWMPFQDPATFWGQSNFVFSVQAQTLKAEYHLKDPFVGLDETQSSTGLTVKGKYFIPLQWGLWAYASVGYSTLRYRFEKLNLDYTNMSSLSLGVSYAF